MGEKCLKTPPQLIYHHTKDFDQLRPLRNADNTWMKIYYRTTREDRGFGGFRTSLSAIGEGLLRRAERFGVKDAERWRAITKGSLKMIK
jgi:hypothetical protein